MNTNTFKEMCRVCRRKTFHFSTNLTSVLISDDEDPNQIYRVTDNIQCCGCGNISLRVKEEDLQRNILDKAIYPNFQSWHLDVKKSIENKLPEKLKKTYNGLIETYNNEQESICAMTLRMIIEGLGIVEKIKDELKNEGIKDFNIKINMIANRLEQKGLITKNIADILKGLKVFGDKAAHNLEEVPKIELKLAIQIIEHILENIYVIQSTFEELMKLREERTNDENGSTNQDDNPDTHR